MTDSLACDISVDGARRPSQWWPLLFDAMQQAGFGLQGPSDAEGTGQALQWNRDDEKNLTLQRVTTQYLRDLVQTEQANLTFYFWSEGNNPFEVWLHLTLEPFDGDPGLASTLPIESLKGDDGVRYSEQELAQRICRWIRSVRNIITLCDLHEAQIYWQKEDWLVGFVGQPRELDCPTTHASKVLQWPLTIGTALSLMTPLPVPRKLGYDFIDLSGCR